MPNEILLIGFKNPKPVAQVYDKNENPTYYFHYLSASEAAQPSARELKEIVYLLNQIYPLTSFPTEAAAVNRLVYANYHSIEKAATVFTSDKHSLLIATPEHHEIHTGHSLPPGKTLEDMPTPTFEKVAVDAPHINESILDQAIKQKLFTHKTNYVNLHIPAQAAMKLGPDETLFPPYTVLQSNSQLINEIIAQSTAITERCEAIKGLARDTETLAQQENLRLEECKELAEQFHHLEAEVNGGLNPTFATDSTTKIGLLRTNLNGDFEKLVNNLQESRLKLIRSLYLCALTYFQSKTIYNLSTAADFNDQFSKVASMEIVDSKAVLHFNSSICNLNFSELKTLINDLLAKFYKSSSWIPYGGSLQKFTLAESVKAELSDITILDTRQNTFDWQWSALRQLGGYDREANHALENMYFGTDLGEQKKKLTALNKKLTEHQAKVDALKVKIEEDQRKLTQAHTHIGKDACEVKQDAQSMNAEYLTLEAQMNTLRLTIANISRLANNLTMPYAALASLIAATEEVQTKIEIQSRIANQRPNSLDIVQQADQNIKTLRQTVASNCDAFLQQIQPLQNLTTLATSIEAQLNSQRSAITPQDQLISITRKFANMLGDVNYFSSLVSSWGGGVNLTVGGITYKVPTSYAKLYTLMKSLTDPLDYHGAVAFWNLAKTFEIEARQRGSHRFFIQVRSNEMSLLLDFIRNLNLRPGASLLDDVDSKLDAIKPSWRLNMERPSIKVKTGVDLSHANIRFHSRTSAQSSTASAASTEASRSSSLSLSPGSSG